MKRKYLYVTAILTCILCPPRAGAEFLEPLGDIYWQTATSAGIFSDSGMRQYEENGGIWSIADDFPMLPDATAVKDTKPVIAIVIDDMGLDRKRSARATLLPPAVTLAYIPYSPHIKQQTDAAKAKGHELIVHIPMQPESKGADPGSDSLTADISPLELHERVVKHLSAFEGYVGVNNHMGSAFTQNADGMSIVIAELKSRGVFFLDSKTAPKSVAERTAITAGVPTTHRDIFIDHFETPEKVSMYLGQIEKIAMMTGSAVAIGHPKDVTLSALEKWLPTLTAKGFRLVPMTEVINIRNKRKQETSQSKIADIGVAKKDVSTP